MSCRVVSCLVVSWSVLERLVVSSNVFECLKRSHHAPHVLQGPPMPYTYLAVFLHMFFVVSVSMNEVRFPTLSPHPLHI
ncbi:hypothetical protein EDB81DRAFT_807312 [Dactylonectria macrodidyma]|uniref:Uncharacterized protein n=1 Tax=Dactylonectria macrodidyma TaxID=307937 RepID=A0A9P9D2X4_9HYPO|nr:hypothetical protein EDB81DRAFT_830373 [Dactylonectria macrodidyma]KAH7111434.1 hypothetical protein EDB81DRAFT_830483 [Dactylonectria macrodidyma]KAH7132942.1 hypothetical protein EDB81DRAFT_807067 [Dactylonectria macrodidyma]KAH7132969.1 hypothetical protein EDB81DRAFT_807312 [Dactylonectria macrodidyma]